MSDANIISLHARRPPSHGSFGHACRWLPEAVLVRRALLSGFDTQRATSNLLAHRPNTRPARLFGYSRSSATASWKPAVSIWASTLTVARNIGDASRMRPLGLPIRHGASPCGRDLG